MSREEEEERAEEQLQHIAADFFKILNDMEKRKKENPDDPSLPSLEVIESARRRFNDYLILSPKGES